MRQASHLTSSQYDGKTSHGTPSSLPVPPQGNEEQQRAGYLSSRHLGTPRPETWVGQSMSLGTFFGPKLSCGLLNHIIVPSCYVAKSAFRLPFQLNNLYISLCLELLKWLNSANRGRGQGSPVGNRKEAKEIGQQLLCVYRVTSAFRAL